MARVARARRAGRRRRGGDHGARRRGGARRPRSRRAPGYVGLVASARRAASVLAALRERGACEEALARVRSPAGLDLGPSPQEEIAVAVLAELVAWRHARASPGPVEAVRRACCGAGLERAQTEGLTGASASRTAS